MTRSWAQQPRTRQQSIAISGVLLIVLVVLIGGLWVAREIHRPPRRVLPPPTHPAVVIVPIGTVPADRLASLAHDYGAEYGLRMTIADPIELPSSGYDVTRGQYVAQDLIAVANAATGSLEASTGTVAVVIGVTTADIYIRDVPWNWAFADRKTGRLAVISVARMPETRYSNRWNLFRKMLTREIGFLCFELPPSDDPYDVLYRSVLGTSDLNRIFDHL